MLTPEQSVLTAILVCLAGAVLTFFLARNKTVAGWAAALATGVSAVWIVSGVIGVLTAGPSAHPVPVLRLPALGYVFRLHVDGLTAVFLLLAACIAVPASLYSVRYLHHYRDYGAARYYPSFLTFLAAMYGLVSTTDMMWFFFVFWQMMTLPGYALIRYEHRIPANVRAANKFLLMMQIACAATMIGAALLTTTGAGATGDTSLKYDFDSVRANLPAMLQARPVATALAFGLFLVGFGIKMGMWPFGQWWLPDACPAAPSPVSALLSGVMIKTGVYGLIRSFLWLVPSTAQAAFPLAAWGMVVALLGTITLFTGTMQALRQEQTKRLLAFHSIGQIGYILLGLGACMALLPAGGPRTATLAAIGLLGALFHVLNHGLFKALLVLNAGSMLHATGTQDLNRMGGLLRFMPLTAITAAVASLSISGVPLFNGFASKWSIYVASLQGAAAAPYLAVCGVIAILTSALTLASFIKFFGASFLSRTSELVRARAAGGRTLEVSPLMQAPQLLLAGACILLGVAPAVALRFLQAALDASRQGLGSAFADAGAMVVGPLTGLAAAGDRAVFVPVVLAVVLGLAFLLAVAVVRLGGAPRRRAEPWLCGYARETEANRYRAHGFYGEFKRWFRWPGGAAKREP